MSQTTDFASNLKLLCSYHKSIAEVCRRLALNRAQFNRYLSGQHKPGANTMLRICNFFGIEEFEALLPHNQFKLLVQVKPREQQPQAAPLPELSHMQRLQAAGTRELERYLGFYFEYYLSMAHPGKLLRTLVCFEKQAQQIYYQRMERMIEFPHKKVYHCRYLGMAHFLVDRIFMLDYESLTGHEISQTILFPTFKNRISQLKGLKIGVSGSGERMPICARVVYEYLGRSINMRKAFALCGLYDIDSPQIDASIRQAVRNEVAEGEWHFRARY
ncbi:helix-turn-helix transcriptional regulator [Shewanella salipaludis]|uniref:Helix-turn-helix transcriptional regulator n=1 Tax=Shewanella salipaludis TaxID=2723052 RepID=A0A972FX33_9GAMM|nr:helix-turn-helix transcriptional regulator [Shewanella salipaludis]NMH64247.1 helix-turn-helix transcriptional regulator [Shewanella salipaludis]